jgi:hypothetical protein
LTKKYLGVALNAEFIYVNVYGTGGSYYYGVAYFEYLLRYLWYARLKNDEPLKKY